MFTINRPGLFIRYGLMNMPINYKDYPPDWKEIRARILARAKNRCEFCGLKNYSYVWSVHFHLRDIDKYKIRNIWFSNEKDAIREARGLTIKKVRVVLTVAHLDHDVENHSVSDDRLKAACQACHCRYDAKIKWERMVSGSK